MDKYLNKYLLGYDSRFYKINNIDYKSDIITATNIIDEITMSIKDFSKRVIDENKFTIIEKEISYKNRICLMQISIPNDEFIKEKEINKSKLEEFKNNINDNKFLYNIVNNLTGRRHDENDFRIISNQIPVVELTNRTYYDYNHSSCLGVIAKEDSFIYDKFIYISLSIKRLDFNKPNLFKNNVTYKHISDLGMTVFMELPNPFDDKKVFKNSVLDIENFRNDIKMLCTNEDLRQSIIDSTTLNSKNRVSKKAYDYKVVLPENNKDGYKIRYKVEVTAGSLFIKIFGKRIKNVI